MQSKPIKNRLYLNSKDGSIDNLFNRTVIECGSSNIKCESDQQLLMACVKAVVPSNIGTFPVEPLTDNRRRLTSDDPVEKSFSGSNIAFEFEFQEPSGGTVNEFKNIIFNGEFDITGTSTVVPSPFSTFENYSHKFTIKNTSADMLAILNSTLSISVPAFIYDPALLLLGQKRISINPLVSAGSTKLRVYTAFSSKIVLQTLGFYSDMELPTNTVIRPAVVDVGDLTFAPYSLNISNALPTIQLRTGYNVNSFCTSGNGATNVLSSFPASVVRSPDNYITLVSAIGDSSVEDSQIIYENKSLVGSHKFIGVDFIDNIDLRLTNSQGDLLNLNNNNYFVCLEVISRNNK